MYAMDSSKDNEVSSNQIEHIPSKSQMKKQLRHQKYLETRGEKRKLERERQKLKRKDLSRQRHEAIARGQSLPEVPSRRANLMANSSNKFRVVIDMDFEDYMTESETSKAVQQLGRIYSVNRHSDNPCQLYFSSMKGKIMETFKQKNSGFKSWDINRSELDYLSLFNSNAGDKTSTSSFVYLSGDSETVLPDTEVILRDDSKIYVIGGLVDHNRHKNLCHTRAMKQNIPTARLPIKENLILNQRHILSTVAVFEVLLNVLSSHKNWRDALVMAVPRRKITQSLTEEDKSVEHSETTDPPTGK